MHYFFTLHDTKTEEIVGHVVPVLPMDISDFDDMLRISWKRFQDENKYFSIEDFVEWHNETYEIQIDWVFGGFI